MHQFPCVPHSLLWFRNHMPVTTSCFSKWKPSRTPDKSIPFKMPSVAGGDSRACIFHLYSDSILVFLSVSITRCPQLSAYNSEIKTARLLPVLVASMEEAFRCLILPLSISGCANKTSPEQTASASMLIKTRKASSARPQTFTCHPLI